MNQKVINLLDDYFERQDRSSVTVTNFLNTLMSIVDLSRTINDMSLTEQQEALAKLAEKLQEETPDSGLIKEHLDQLISLSQSIKNQQ